MDTAIAFTFAALFLLVFLAIIALCAPPIRRH